MFEVLCCDFKVMLEERNVRLKTKQIKDECSLVHISNVLEFNDNFIIILLLFFIFTMSPIIVGIIGLRSLKASSSKILKYQQI